MMRLTDQILRVAQLKEGEPSNLLTFSLSSFLIQEGQTADSEEVGQTQPDCRFSQREVQ